MAAKSVRSVVAEGFDVDAYWRASGPYIAKASESAEHKLVDGVLAALLPSLKAIKDVLDVGCGRGRIATILRDALPAAAYSGLDIGEAQIRYTRSVRPEGEFYLSRLQDFEPERSWDLITASEVLMHIPPDDIWAVCDNLKRLARRYIVTIDWTEPLAEPIAPWNWLYDYRTLFGADRVRQAIPIGLQTLFVIEP